MRRVRRTQCEVRQDEGGEKRGKRKESGTRWPEHWLDCIGLSLVPMINELYRKLLSLAVTTTRLTKFARVLPMMRMYILTGCNLLFIVKVGLSSLPPLMFGEPADSSVVHHSSALCWHTRDWPHPLSSSIPSLSCPELVRGVTSRAVPLVWAHVTKSLSINHWTFRSPSLVKRDAVNKKKEKYTFPCSAWISLLCILLIVISVCLFKPVFFLL